MTVTHHEIRESEGQRKAWSVSPLAEESVDESSVDDHKYHQPTQRNKPYLNASYPPPSNPSYHMTYPPMATPSPYAYYAASFHHARRHASLYQSNGRHRQPISYFRPSCLFPPKASTPMSDAKRVQPTQGSFCTCKKSRCLKLYCQCFAASAVCGVECKCQDCQNTADNAEMVQKARKIIMERNPCAFAKENPAHFDLRHRSPTVVASTVPAATQEKAPVKASLNQCKCRRSQCLKKYCDCFQSGNYCNSTCQCLDCHNFNEPIRKDIDKILEEVAKPLNRSLQEEKKELTTNSDSGKDEYNITEDEHDNMVIMAAVAMTELLSQVKGPKSEKDESNSQNFKEKYQISGDGVAIPASRNATKKRKHKEALWEEEEVQAVVSEESNCSLESRNPSPSFCRNFRAYGQHPPFAMYGARSSTPPSHYQVSTPPFHYMQVRGSSPMYRHRLPPHVPNPPTGTYRSQFMRRPLSPKLPAFGSPVTAPYDDMIRNSGLPKSLSFRKICSRCGKTRGEHGELGFGNKCTFDECGKCGASLQKHVQHEQPMGILCQLTVAQGAMPGKMMHYKKQLQDLANRADLQKALKRREE